MSLLRTLPTGRLIALLIAVAAIAAGGTAIALGAGGGAKPPSKSLAGAVHEAVAAPEVNGITARIKFTNKLVDSSSLEGGGPLLKGGTGRLWLGDGHKLRLELQTDNGVDAQIVSDGVNAWVYDPGSGTVYSGKLPQDKKKADQAGDKLPTLAEIQKQLDELAKTADLSGPTPDNVAGQPAYSVRISPKHDGGLLGAAALAWDAAKGVPLRAAVYAQGTSTPVLELTATEIKYGKVAARSFTGSPPAGAKKVNVDVPSGAGAKPEPSGKKEQAVTGLGPVSSAVPFKLSAPAKLVGLPRHEVRLVDWKGKKAAVVTYGQGLGGMVVIQQPADPAPKPAAPSDKHGDHGGGLTLPKVSINGATGEELDTALATMIRFQRGGVAYTVLGSVPPAAAKAAAEAL